MKSKDTVIICSLKEFIICSIFVVVLSMGIGFLVGNMVATDVVTIPCQADIFTVGIQRHKGEDVTAFADRASGIHSCIETYYNVIHYEPAIEMKNGKPNVVGFVIFYLPKDKENEQSKNRDRSNKRSQE